MSTSAEDVEAIVRRVLADILAKQHAGGSGTCSHTSSGEILNLEDFELPDDLGSMFTAVTLPNELKNGVGRDERNAGGLVSGISVRIHVHASRPLRHYLSYINLYSTLCTD